MSNPSRRVQAGFTLIEMLIVIAIIAGPLSGIILVALNDARAKARDVQRLVDMRGIQTLILIYFQDEGELPSNRDTTDCTGWDVGYNGGVDSGDEFIQDLVSSGEVGKVQGDPTSTGACAGYAYYRYDAGSQGCDASKGAFYVLGVRDMESTSNPHPQSPGFSCGTRNWQDEFDWVTGQFERNL